MKSTRRLQFVSIVMATVFTPVAWAGFDAPRRTASGADGLAVGDLNRDGRDDVVTFSAGDSPVLRVLLGRANGSFREMAALTGADGRLTGMPDEPIVDWNGDGVLDVVSASYKLNSKIRRGMWWGVWMNLADYTVYQYLWLGNGDGTFAPRVITSQLELKGFPVPTEEFHRAGLHGEFNNDGLQDGAGFSYDRRDRLVGPLLVYLQIDGDEEPQTLSFAVGTGVFSSMAAGDFNGDGWNDLVLAKSGALLTLINDADW